MIIVAPFYLFHILSYNLVFSLYRYSIVLAIYICISISTVMVFVFLHSIH